MGMILGYVFPPMSNSQYTESLRQVAVLWTDKDAEISFQWGAIQYIPADKGVSDEQIVKDSVALMPDDVRNFINFYNDPETHEEAKVLYALGYVEGVDLEVYVRNFINFYNDSDCDND